MPKLTIDDKLWIIVPMDLTKQGLAERGWGPQRSIQRTHRGDRVSRWTRELGRLAERIQRGGVHAEQARREQGIITRKMARRGIIS